MTVRPPDTAASRRGSRWLGFAAAFSLITGCTLSPAAPTIDGVSPNWGYNGEPTEIEITGAHFFPTVIVGDAVGSTDEDDGRIEGTFQAWLVGEETFELDGERHLSYDRIRAEVPEDLPIGIYDLRVEVPSGLVTTAADLFTVTDTRADHLVVAVEDVAYTVGEEAALTVSLEDPEDQPVAQPLVIQIIARPETEGTKVTFDPDGLIDQQPLEGGGGVRGRLSSTGIGKVKVTSQAVDDIKFEVSAVAPTTVEGDEVTLSWAAGDVSTVEVILPSSNFEAVAGEAFDVIVRFRDPFGNVLPSEGTVVTLSDACGTWFEVNAEVGAGDIVNVRLIEACAENRIVVSAFADEFMSDVFAVVPGPHDGYTVEPVFESVIAGAELPIFVTAVDEFDNVLTDHSADLSIFDDLGGLDPWRSRGEQICTGFTGGTNYCRVYPWTAGPEVVLRAVGAGKVSLAEPIEVVPAEPSDVLVLIDDDSVEAGELFHATVRVLDIYENSVWFDPVGDDPVSWEDESGTIGCVWTGSEEGAQGFDCAVLGAVSDANVQAHVFGLPGELDHVLVVTNAALEAVEVDPQGGAYVAGTAFTVELRGFDAYGNAYTVQTNPTIELTDTAGTMSPGTAVIGPTGVVQVSAVVYSAGNGVRLYASQDGVALGASRPLFVSPDVMEGFAVEAPAWISVDEPSEVSVTAVDAYGNAITSYTGSVTLSSIGQACDELEVSTFSAGTATVDVTCDDPRLSEGLLAVDTAGFEGESDVVDVVDLACADGPTAVLMLDGDDDTRRCLADGASIEVEADASASVAGASSIALRHFTDVETLSVRTPGDVTTFTYDTTGTRSVELLVADSRACASIASGVAYVGSDDGEPTGPISVSASASSVATGGELTIAVSARDCTEDLAAGQELLVRADLGTTTGTSTGEGLLVTLDAAGSARLTWTLDTEYAGTATVYAGSAGGGAFGAKTVAVTGDSAHPTVVEVTPSGVELGTISAVEVTFSEEMNASRMTSLYLPLTGPGGAVTSDYTLGLDSKTLTITPRTPLDGASGTYTLSLSQEIRDLAGNRLDGGWSGGWGPATFVFGDVGESVPAVSSCATSVAAFTPDGDDGAGTETDAVSVTPTATASPTWWWLSVYDVDGTRVRSLRTVGTETRVTWDGRGNDGILRAVGRYRLALAPIDSSGNVGGQCDVTVDLRQHVDGP